MVQRRPEASAKSGATGQGIGASQVQSEINADMV